MQLRVILQQVLLMVIFSGSIIFFLYHTPTHHVQGKLGMNAEYDVGFTNRERVDVGLPKRLKIPSINVDAPIEHVGLTPDGAMDTPKNSENVAWFEPGTRPGESGSAVVAGHYGWEKGKSSAFDNLHRLRKGDKIYIEDTTGVAVVFVVRESRSYDPDGDTLGVFNSNDGLAHLNLITCEGDWDDVKKSYSKRFVVFTDRE